VAKDSHMMTDQLRSYRSIAKGYASHRSIHHGVKEYVCREVLNNTSKSFGAVMARAEQWGIIFGARNI